MIFEINDQFPNIGNWRYNGEVLANILQKDSGYIKDLIKLHSFFCISRECMSLAQNITKGFHDTWTPPEHPKSILEKFRPYKMAYDFDFNDESIVILNEQKLNRVMR